MINSMSDMLIKLKDREQELLKKYEIIKNPGIIGDMYEGLTKTIIDKSLFHKLDLHIRAGKIRNSKNEFSDEIDCMIVLGNGERIPHTDKYIYDSKKVIAVFQVKKNLFSKDIDDSFKNLRSVINVTEPLNDKLFHKRLFRDSWRSICNEELPSDLNVISPEKSMLYHILNLETIYPLRIVWGYNGFKSEYSLRKSFIKYLEGNVSQNEKSKKKGFGPLSFPNLIICDKYSLIKANGIPFAQPIDKDSWWPFYASSYKNPMYFFLEMIWTRLQYMFEIDPEIFGEDLKCEAMHGLLLCKYKENKDIKGWEYSYIRADKKMLKKPLINIDWEPVFVDEEQYIVLNILCSSKSINCKDNSELNEFIKKTGYTLELFIDRLKETGLVNYRNDFLSLITAECVCGITQDGKYFAGDNKTGRVSRWADKQMSKDHKYLDLKKIVPK